ncbi:MAG: hypothetical protein DRN81_07550, partial [Thermoproteota archaeon]
QAVSLFRGDLLLVTNASGAALKALQRLSLGDTSFQEIWRVDSYSRYQPSIGPKPSVFVANVGWVGDGIPGRRIGVVVIDGMHPRTLNKAPKVLASMPDIPLSFIICPPLLEHELKEMGYPKDTKVWLWDPNAQQHVSECLAVPSCVDLGPVKRNIWVCTDSDIEKPLGDIHVLLAACQKEGRKKFPPLWEAWNIYHRLRQLAVPLPEFEDSAYDTWGAVTIKKRLTFLANEWPEDSAIEARWRQILQGLEKVYELLLGRREPAKFWAIAERIQHYLNQNDEQLRIVVPSEREVVLLSVCLGYVIDSWSEAQQEGRIEVVSARREARKIAAGDFRTTILAGYRAGSQRHLDLYPSYPVEVMAYSYEASVDQSLHDHIYSFVEKFQKNDARRTVLRSMEMDCPENGDSLVSSRPIITVTGNFKHEIKKARKPLQDPSTFDLEQLADIGFPQDWTDEPISAFSDSIVVGQEITEIIQVVFNDGRKMNYLPHHGVDVYSPGTEKIHRIEAFKLQAGKRVVCMVDGTYDNLHERLVEALNFKLNAYYRMLMTLWEQSKLKALQKHNGNRRDLHRALAKLGLSTEYAAVVSLYREEGFETIAPQQYDDMKVLAEHSGVYDNKELIKVTFKVIQQERGRRIRAGRALHALLRAIATGDGYAKALYTAREIGAEVGEVLEA